MKKYYYAEAQNQFGPFDLNELKNKQITRDTLVWSEDFDDWKKAGDVEEVNQLLKSIPPPYKGKTVKTPPPIKKAKPLTKQSDQKNRILVGSLIAGAVVIFFLVVSLMIRDNTPPPTYTGYTDDFSNSDQATNNEPSTIEPVGSEPAKQHTTRLSSSGGSYKKQNSQSKPAIKARPKTEAELRQELYEKEAYKPSKYLDVSYTYKVNLLANTILEGSIYNSASVAGFTNITIRANFYNKYNELIGQEDFTVSEFVAPGDKTSFRHKIVGWWKGVKRSDYVLLGAEGFSY